MDRDQCCAESSLMEKLEAKCKTAGLKVQIVIRIASSHGDLSPVIRPIFLIVLSDLLFAQVFSM